MGDADEWVNISPLDGASRPRACVRLNDVGDSGIEITATLGTIWLSHEEAVNLTVYLIEKFGIKTG